MERDYTLAWLSNFNDLPLVLGSLSSVTPLVCKAFFPQRFRLRARACCYVMKQWHLLLAAFGEPIKTENKFGLSTITD